MKKYGPVLFAAAFFLLPDLARAGGKGVAMPEPGTMTLIGVGLLAIAGILGVSTVRLFLAGKRTSQ
jgi:hypothetical protein